MPKCPDCGQDHDEEFREITEVRSAILGDAKVLMEKYGTYKSMENHTGFVLGMLDAAVATAIIGFGVRPTAIQVAEFSETVLSMIAKMVECSAEGVDIATFKN
jgi:hypothetical protein